MIDFILYDDNNKFLNDLETTIRSYMMNLEIDYKIHKFSSFGKDMKEVLKKENTHKVYFLDIETHDMSGLDVFRSIREEVNDWHSLVLFVTNHNEYKYEALANRLYLFDFINKLDSAKKHINKALDRIMNIYFSDKMCLEINNKSNYYRLSFRDIIQISKIKNTNKCLVKTTYDEIECNSTLKSLSNKLNNDFIKVSSSNIINKKHILKYDSKDNRIVFKNKAESRNISRSGKKALDQVVW